MTEWEDVDDGFSLNLSDKEADSEVREFSSLPSGSYLVVISDAELHESTSEKNSGKPYATFELTVIEDAAGGKYVGAKAWWNVMLWQGAGYSAAQLMKTQDLDPRVDKFPSLPQWQGKKFVMVGSQEQAKSKSDEVDSKGKPKYVPKFANEVVDGKEVRKPVMKYEVNGAKHANTWKGSATKVEAATTRRDTLLPS